MLFLFTTYKLMYLTHYFFIYLFWVLLCLHCAVIRRFILTWYKEIVLVWLGMRPFMFSRLLFEYKEKNKKMFNLVLLGWASRWSRHTTWVCGCVLRGLTGPIVTVCPDLSVTDHLGPQDDWHIRVLEWTPKPNQTQDRILSIHCHHSSYKNIPFDSMGSETQH